MIRSFFCFVFILSLGVACSSPHQSSDSNPALVGYGLIDEGRAEEAIDHFRALVEQHPDSDEYRRGLSSAYALRGGFRIQNLVQPMKDIQAAENTREEYLELVDQKSKSEIPAEGFENSISFEIDLLIFMKKFAAVPAVSESEVKDLKLSISTLYSLKKVTQGDSLYIAVLESLILKHNLMKPMNAYNCEDSLALIQSRVQGAASQYGKILVLLAQAQPSQALNFEKQQEVIAKVSAETSLLTKSSLMTLSLMPYVSGTKSPIRIFKMPPQCNI